MLRSPSPSGFQQRFAFLRDLDNVAKYGGGGVCSVDGGERCLPFASGQTGAYPVGPYLTDPLGGIVSSPVPSHSVGFQLVTAACKTRGYHGFSSDLVSRIVMS